jgi:hypothetical protein
MEVRHTSTNWRRIGVFFLSIPAGAPLVWGLMFLTGMNPLAVLAAFLLPAVALVVFWRRGYRCGGCGGRCAPLVDAPGCWRFYCPRCEIEWTVDKPDSGAAA